MPLPLSSPVECPGPTRATKAVSSPTSGISGHPRLTVVGSHKVTGENPPFCCSPLWTKRETGGAKLIGPGPGGRVALGALPGRAQLRLPSASPCNQRDAPEGRWELPGHVFSKTRGGKGRGHKQGWHAGALRRLPWLRSCQKE